MSWLAVKLFLGGAMSKLGAFLKSLSLWQIVSLGLAIFALIQHFELAHSRAEAARWQKQFTAEHNARLADRKAYSDAQAKAAADNKAHVQQIETQQLKVTTDVETDYRRKLAILRSELRNAAPQGDSGGPGIPQVPDASSGPDAQAGVLLPNPERLRAAEIELQLDELITWVEQQEKANDGSQPTNGHGGGN